MDTAQEMYIFILSSKNGSNKITTPYFYNWIESTGNKIFYNKIDIEKLLVELPGSLQNKILSMQEGSLVQITKLSALTHLTLRKLKESEYLVLLDVENKKIQLENIYEAIKIKCVKELKTISDIKASLKATQIEVAKIIKL